MAVSLAAFPLAQYNLCSSLQNHKEQNQMHVPPCRGGLDLMERPARRGQCTKLKDF